MTYTLDTDHLPTGFKLRRGHSTRLLVGLSMTALITGALLGAVVGAVGAVDGIQRELSARSHALRRRLEETLDDLGADIDEDE